MTNSKQFSGYSIAVGGVVLCDHKVLLVRRASGGREGEYQIPGGLVEQNESIHAAVEREVFEETGMRPKIEGLIAVLNRALEDENNTYFVFLLTAENENAKADGCEVDDAHFFSLGELRQLPRLQSLTRLIVTAALQNEATMLPFYGRSGIPLDKEILFAGENVSPEYRRLVHALWYEPFTE